MSFIRWGEQGSNVYVFESDEGYEILGTPGDHVIVVPTREDCIAKLHEIKRDHPEMCIPDKVFRALAEDDGG